MEGNWPLTECYEGVSVHSGGKNTSGTLRSWISVAHNGIYVSSAEIPQPTVFAGEAVRASGVL